MVVLIVALKNVRKNIYVKSGRVSSTKMFNTQCENCNKKSIYHSQKKQSYFCRSCGYTGTTQNPQPTQQAPKGLFMKLLVALNDGQPL